MSDNKLLTEADLKIIESHVDPRIDFDEDIGRLIADHRRLTEAIRRKGHGMTAEYWYLCGWNGVISNRNRDDCTRENCIWMECQP